MSGKSLKLCQVPSDMTNFLENNPIFIEKISKGIEENISMVIKSIFSTSHNTRYATDNKQFLSSQEKIETLQNCISNESFSIIKGNIYKVLKDYNKIDKESISFQDLWNVVETNRKLFEWILQDDPKQVIENMFGETADQRFEQERLWLFPQIKISHFYNGWSDHISKPLPEWYCSDANNTLYKWDNNKSYTPVEMYNSESPITVYDYDEQIWIIASLYKTHPKKGNYYKLLSFQENKIAPYNEEEYLDVRFKENYMTYMKEDWLVRINIRDEENKYYNNRSYPLPVDEEDLWYISDVLYNKEDDCILTICSTNWRYNFYLVFGDWSIFSELDIDIMHFYDFMKFTNWELKFIADTDAAKKYHSTFFWKLFGKSKNIPDYLSIEDDGLVHKIDLHKLHTYLQSNELK